MPESESTPGKDRFNRIRVRVNGLLVMDQSLLMVQLLSPVNGEVIWMPPGGGLKYGELLESAVRREMFEETGLEVDAGPLWYIHEVRTSGIHAIEFYFLCRKVGGELGKGADPEYGDEDQIIRDVSFFPLDSLNRPDVYPVYIRTGFVEDYRSETAQLPKRI